MYILFTCIFSNFSNLFLFEYFSHFPIHIFYIFSFAYDKSRHTLSQKENAKNPYKIKVSGIFFFSTKQDKSHIFIIK